MATCRVRFQPVPHHNAASRLDRIATLTTQRPGSPELPAGAAGVTVTNQPIIFSSGATLGATQRFNRLELSLKGTFDRTVNQNATQSMARSSILPRTISTPMARDGPRGLRDLAKAQTVRRGDGGHAPL
jgi:hypothetical protein